MFAHTHHIFYQMNHLEFLWFFFSFSLFSLTTKTQLELRVFRNWMKMLLIRPWSNTDWTKSLLLATSGMTLLIYIYIYVDIYGHACVVVRLCIGIYNAILKAIYALLLRWLHCWHQLSWFWVLIDFWNCPFLKMYTFLYGF